jgi:HPt (histidine-containing phosphotransfer) domain-containing protein
LRNDDIYGIDVKKGMALVGNNKTVYLKLLKSFSSNSLCGELLDAVAASDVELTKQKAHALKGVSGNLHMDPLFERVKAIESDVRESNSVSPEDEKIAELKETIRGTLESVGMLIENPDLLNAIE